MLKMHTERKKSFYCYMILTRIGMCPLSFSFKFHENRFNNQVVKKQTDTVKLTLTLLQLSMHMWQKTNTNSRHGFNTYMEQYNVQHLLYFVHFVPTTFSTCLFFKVYFSDSIKDKTIASIHIFHFSTKQNNRPKIFEKKSSLKLKCE
jgi:hypothetical protein